MGNDLREGKVTLPLILALNQGGPAERELVEQVIRDGQALVTTDAQEDRRLDEYQSVSELQLHSVMCAPLVAGEQDAAPHEALDQPEHDSALCSRGAAVSHP